MFALFCVLVLLLFVLDCVFVSCFGVVCLLMCGCLFFVGVLLLLRYAPIACLLVRVFGFCGLGCCCLVLVVFTSVCQMFVVGVSLLCCLFSCLCLSVLIV